MPVDTEESATESESYDSDESPLSTTPAATSPCVRAQHGAASAAPAASVEAPLAAADHSQVTPHWNSVLFIETETQRTAAPRNKPLSATDEPASQAFVSPFASLVSLPSVVSTEPVTPPATGDVCPRCRACLDREGSDERADACSFCLCCHRPLPTRAFYASANTSVVKTCIQCASEADPKPTDRQTHELPDRVRVADDATKAIATVEKKIMAYNTVRTERELRFPPLCVQSDDRIKSLASLDAARVAKRNQLELKLTQVLRGGGATVAEGEALFSEWLSLETERGSRCLEKLLVLDELLASRYLRLPSRVARVMRAAGLPLVDPFPVPAAGIDDAARCDECDVMLASPPAAVAADVEVAFCDCCKRMLPSTEVANRWPGSLSFCKKCRVRRDFSLISEDNLVRRPDPYWSKLLLDTSESLCAATTHLDAARDPVAATRLAEARKEIAPWDDRVRGLPQFQLAAIRAGDTSMVESRHWYVEQVMVDHGFQSAVLKLLQIYTDVAGGGDYKAWKPVVKLVQEPRVGIVLPQWLVTFVNDRWSPESVALHGSDPVVPTNTTPKAAPKAVAKPATKTKAVAPVAKEIPANPLPKTKAGKKANVLAAATAVAKEAAAHAVPLNLECPGCGEQIDLGPADKGEPFFCDCCELTLSKSMIDPRTVRSSVSLCKTCAASASSRPVEQLRRRADPVRLARLLSEVGFLRNRIKASRNAGGTAAATVGVPDTRLLSADQEFAQLRATHNALRHQQRKAVTTKKGRNVHLVRRALYAEEVKTSNAFLDASIEFLQVVLEESTTCGIVISAEMRAKIMKLLVEEEKEPEPEPQEREKDRNVGNKKNAKQKQKKAVVVSHSAPQNNGASGARAVEPSRMDVDGPRQFSSQDHRPETTALHKDAFGRDIPESPMPRVDQRRDYDASYRKRRDRSRSRSWSRGDRRYRSRSRSRSRDRYRDRSGSHSWSRHERDDYRYHPSSGPPAPRDEYHHYHHYDKRARTDQW